MVKIKIILILLLVSSLNSFAQKLTENEKAVFDELVYNRKRVGDYETLTKWAKPIRYKIYGDTSAYLVKEVDSFFSFLKNITLLDIKKTNDENDVNFTFVFGTKPEDFKEYTIYKKPLETPANYRRKVTYKSEIEGASILINIKKFPERIKVKNAFKKYLIKCFGFPNDTELAPNSVFNTKSFFNFKIEDFDIHIIAALYNPAIKPGMTKDEVDKINP